MIEETFLRLHPSESVVSSMAAQILSAFILSGKVESGNEDAYIDQAANLAIKLAKRIDRAVESDDESGDR